MDMGERIKELRIQNNLTQEELGAKLGIQKSAVAKYESGRVKNLKSSTIKKMAQLFNVEPSYILGWDDGSYEGASLSKDDIALLQTYNRAKRSNDPVLKALIDAIDKRIREYADKDE